MASIGKVSLDSFLGTPNASYDSNYKIWTNKSEWKRVGQIRARLQDMYQARQSSCPFTNYDGTSSWDSHWNMLEKDHIMFSEAGDPDDWESNLKSSIAYRTTSNLDARERKQDISFLVEARNESDENKGRAVTFKYIFEDYFRRNLSIRYKFLDASKRAKIFGTSVAYVPYVINMRTVSYPKDVDITNDDIKAGKIPGAEYEDKTIVDFEDVDFVPWDIRDFYIDPNAQYLHGTTNAATDAAGILYVTPSQVRLMFQGDPDIINLDKIDNTSNHESYSQPFFKTPRDHAKGYDELVYYYNIETDSEVIIYGDVLLKDGPIPYTDKQIPFVAFQFIRYPGSFYGMGVGDVTIQQSSEEAAIKNMVINRLHLITNPPTFVGATIFGDVDDQWDRIEPNAIIKVGDVTQVRGMQFPNIPFDAYRVMESLKDEAVMNTGVNPQGMTLPMSSTPATNTLSMKETMSDMMNLYEDNLMAGMNDWGKMLYNRFCQFYKQPTKKAALELDKKQMRELRLEDIDLFVDANGKYNTRDIKGSKIIPLTDDMFQWDGEPKVYINPDFVEPISHAFKMRKAEEILPQLVQLAGDRNTKMQNGQTAVIDMRKLVKWYLDEMDMTGEDLLIDDDEDRIDEIKQAIDQQEKMQAGENVAGKPGEPLAHRYTHSIELRRLNDTMSSDEFSKMRMAMDKDIQAFAMAMDSYRKDLTEHLRLDNLLVTDSPDEAIKESDAMAQVMQQMMNPQMGGQMGMQQGMQPGMPMPQNNMVSVPTVTGNQGLPNGGGSMPVPNNASQANLSGQAAQF